MTLILAIIFGLSRAAHGGGYVSRVVSAAIMGVAYCSYMALLGWGALDAIACGLIAFLGLWGGLLLGWGKGFATVTGRYNPAEKEFWPADRVGDLVYAKWGNPYYAGIAFMTVRAVLFYPVFVALAAYTGLWAAYLLSGLAVFSMGLVYWWSGKISPEKNSIRLAEIAYFAILGWALV